MNSPWELITSLGIHFYTLNDEKLKPGSKACNIDKRPCIVEENLDSLRDDFICNSHGCSTQFNSLSELESHQRSRHTHVCVDCKAIFPSFHLLDRHVTEMHDSFFQIASQKKPMYVCLVEHCQEIFQTPFERKQHCMKDHKFPSDFRFDLQWRKLKPPKKNTKNNNNANNKGKNTKQLPESNVSNPDENMDIIDNENVPRNTFKCPKKVPKLISFGIGVPRGFIKNKGSGGRHWHQRNKPDGTQKNIEHISMSDINLALEEVETMES